MGEFSVDDKAPDGLRELRGSAPSEVLITELAHPLVGRTLVVEGLRTVALPARSSAWRVGRLGRAQRDEPGRAEGAGRRGRVALPAGVRRLRALLIVLGGDHSGT